MGREINKSFFRGLNVNISCYNLFLQFLYYRRRNKRPRETFISMLSCGALERSHNSYQGGLNKKEIQLNLCNIKNIKHPW